MPASGGSRRAWGWHPLVDEWAGHVVAQAPIRPGDLVIDIGAGDGALTAHLIEAGARVIALELHAGRAQRLRERFTGAPVSVVHADAAELRLPHRPFRVVANPPYNISSGLLRTLLSPASKLISADLVFQRGFVNRALAIQGWGLSFLRGSVVASRSRWQLKLGYPLPRRAFRPPPQVDSAVLMIRRR